MSKFSVEAFMANLPAPILEDEHLRQLAEVAARVMLKTMHYPQKASIYSRIDSLDEDVLDILAYDLKIDWYDYDASLEVKRRMVKDSWYVHKRMGTVAAVEKALSDVWPSSTVEEWFDYGGDPYHFRVILDATEDANPIYLDNALDKVRIFKPARAVMDNNEPIVKISCGIVISPSTKGHTYHVVPAGMLPTRATHGQHDRGGLTVETGGLTNTYHVRRCGHSIRALM